MYVSLMGKACAAKVARIGLKPVSIKDFPVFNKVFNKDGIAFNKSRRAGLINMRFSSFVQAFGHFPGRRRI